MVDPAGGIGRVQNVTSINKASSSEGRRAEDAEESRRAEEPRDEIEISEEALVKAAAEARRQIEDNPEVTLGLNPAFDESA